MDGAINNIVNIETTQTEITSDIIENSIHVEIVGRGPVGKEGPAGPAGSGKYTIIDISEDYIAEQLTGNYLLNCSGEISITLPTTTEAIFSIRNENGEITITNEVNGEENKVLKYINSSITLISIGDGKYNII